MKHLPTLKIFLLCCGLWPTALLWSQPARQYSTMASRKAFYESLAREYNTKGIQEILQSDKKNEFEAYVEGHSEKELVHEFETVVHELLHGYNGQGLQSSYRYFFPGPGERIQVPMTKVFSSRELSSFVPRGRQDSVFRYAIYVGGKQATAKYGKQEIRFNNGGNGDISSVTDGLYGILEEFNAYYSGTLATWELKKYYQDTYGSENPEIWAEYKHQLLGNAQAYHEFRLFMAWYLLYAKQKHPSVYAGLMENKALRKVFTQLCDRYGALLTKIEAAIPELDQLSGEDVEDILQMSGSDEEIRALLAQNGVDAEAMGLKPGTPEWEKIKDELMRSLGEARSSVSQNLDFFHSLPKAQMTYLKSLMKDKEREILQNFRLDD
ncbi:MAG: hypothetical protein H6581_26200 [Bacteroidia bacterium]|nr:hypothetical protein [Bacteroidia bacterium]